MKNAKSFPMRMCLVLSLLSVIAYAPSIVGLPFADGAFSQLERMWHHSSFEWRASKLQAGDERLLVLAVDDKAVGELGFPLPRHYYAKALNEMTRLGAKVVIFDVLFLEPREGDKEFA